MDEPVIRIAGGAVRGRFEGDGVAVFRGMPFAQPPVGALRWREPVPKKAWSGVRGAVSFGASCTQPVLSGAWNRYDAENSQEDCLYLNVISPVWPVAKPLPVMFWLHGGANEGGSGSGALYNDGTLTAHGVLLVTINYRLGVLGRTGGARIARAPQAMGSRAAKRRRDVLRGLLLAVGVTGVLALGINTSPLWVLHGLTDLALVAFLGLWMYARALDAERAAKVRPMRRHPSHQGELPLRHVASS